MNRAEQHKTLRREFNQALASEATALQRAVQLSLAGAPAHEVESATRQVDAIRHERVRLGRLLRELSTSEQA